MRTGVVKQSWLEKAPHRGWDAKFWIGVSQHLSTRGVADTPENVQAAITSVEMTEAADIADACVKRDAAADLLNEARRLEAKWS